MNDPVETPTEPVPPAHIPPPTPAAPNTAAPQHRPNKFKRTLTAIAGNDFIQAFFIFIVLVCVAGAAYYIGWHRGYNNAINTAACPASSAFCDNTNQMPGGVYKPVIYLYPTQTERVNVHVIYPAGFTYTDPAYNPSSGWSVLATPNGSLTNLADNTQYPYLVWEGNPLPFTIDMSSGFVVPGSQTSSFLRAELPVIGLSPSETNAFIAYWLPKMSGDKYNLIHFVGTQYTNYAKLIISPKPDSELRVMMAYEPLDTPVSVKPQSFPIFHRSGFTVVEWGGTELTP